MKRKDLLSALLAVKPGIATKDVIESMTYFFFSGDAVISYNDIISIQYPLKTSFNTFVKADDFFKVVSKVKSETVEFKLDEASLNMKADKMMSSFATIFDDSIVSRIQTVSDSLKDASMKKLPVDFIDAVKLCSHVASKNESDSMLTCLYVSKKNVVCTDNVRIAHYTMKTAMDEFMVKASEMKALIAINPTKYAVTSKWAHFSNDEGCVFSIRLVKGNYPDMIKFTDFDGIDIKLPKDILDGVDIASIFSEDADDAISITIIKGKCRVFKESDAGKIDFRTTIDYNGQDITFKINPELLKEMMAHTTNIVVAVRSARLETDSFVLVTSLFAE